MKLRYSFIVIGLLRLLSLLSLQQLRRIAKYIGPVLLRRSKRTTEAIDKNLLLCQPHLTSIERNDFIKQRLAYMCQTLFEMSHVWIKSSEQLKQYLQPHYDNAVFEAEFNSDNSIIILSPHIGNWEMMNIYLSQFRALTVMYQPLKESCLDAFIRRARECAGTLLVPTNTKGIMQVIRVLKNKGMVGFLPDQVPEENVGGVFAPFFGHQAYTMTLTHKLALKTNAKVFLGVAYQCEQGFSVSMKPMAAEFYSENSAIAATCLNEAIEAAILEQPLQNQWEYKRFRVQPQGNKSLYK